ncbi:DotA/TraY family protein [Marinobacterium jannaschii]|uniref:DotA/TraY family protein n=1 Tax=Marinobacterium jannaschii TaxID=64970 RepID=UPI0004890001|nr:DotA/TraY family protein [Marinobacterium jannaschii]
MNIYRISRLAAVIFLLCSSFAYANPIEEMNQVWKDGALEESRSIQILRAVLGGIVHDAAGQTASADGASGMLGAMMAVYNIGVMTILGAMLFILFVSRGIDAGTEGSLLSKRYNSTWVPIRTGGSIIGLMPAVGGWSLAQKLVMTFVVYTTHIADMTAMAGNAYTIANGGIQEFTPNRNSLIPLARQLYKMEICRYVQNQEHTGGPIDTSNELIDGVTSTSSDYFFEVRYDRRVPYSTGQPACGSVRLDLSGIANDAHDYSSDSATSWITESHDQMNAVKRESAKKAVIAYHSAVVEVLRSLEANSSPSLKISPSSHKFKSPVISYDKVLLQEIVYTLENAIRSTYNSEVTKHLNKIISGEAPLDSEQYRPGWIMQGFYLPAQIRAMQFMASLSKIAPTYHEPQAIRVVEEENNSTENPSQELKEGLIDLGAFFIEEPADSLSIIGIKAREQLLVLHNEDQDALTNIQNLGHNLIIFSSTALLSIQTALAMERATDEAAEAAADAAARAASGIPLFGGAAAAVIKGAQTAADVISGALLNDQMIGLLYKWIAGSLIALLILGLLMAYWIPLQPAIIWLLSIITWIGQVVMIMFGTALWAAAHAMPEGDGISGTTGRAGYAVLISVVTRPIILILTYPTALLILNGMTPIIGMIWMYFDGMNQGYVALLGNLFAVGMLYVVLQVIVSRVFNLLHEIPDEIPKLIQAPISGGGEGIYQAGDSKMGGVTQHIKEVSRSTPGPSGQATDGISASSGMPDISDDQRMDRHF